MRHAKNFHSEWGYLTPTPGFTRTTRIVLLATAIGAIAGGGVVLSLVDSSDSQTSMAARTLAPSVIAALMPVSAPEAAQLYVPAAVQSEPTKHSGANGHVGGDSRADGHAGGAAASDSSTTPITPGPAGISALAEVRPDDASAKAMTAPPTAAAAPVENKATKKHHVATRYYAPRGGLLGLELGEHYTNGTSGGPYRDGRWGGFYQNGGDRYHAWGYSGG
jgi:hypothetical protein